LVTTCQDIFIPTERPNLFISLDGLRIRVNGVTMPFGQMAADLVDTHITALVSWVNRSPQQWNLQEWNDFCRIPSNYNGVRQVVAKLFQRILTAIPPPPPLAVDPVTPAAAVIGPAALPAPAPPAAAVIAPAPPAAVFAPAPPAAVFAPAPPAAVFAPAPLAAVFAPAPPAAVFAPAPQAAAVIAPAPDPQAAADFNMIDFNIEDFQMELNAMLSWF
jgi:hypothetical protein